MCAGVCVFCWTQVRSQMSGNNVSIATACSARFWEHVSVCSECSMFQKNKHAESVRHQLCRVVDVG